MQAYPTIAKNTSPNINAQLLLVSSLEYSIRIVLCPLVVVVKMSRLKPASSEKSTDKRKSNSAECARLSTCLSPGHTENVWLQQMFMQYSPRSHLRDNEFCRCSPRVYTRILFSRFQDTLFNIRSSA
jgi:hypothetical protein